MTVSGLCPGCKRPLAQGNRKVGGGAVGGGFEAGTGAGVGRVVLQGHGNDTDEETACWEGTDRL